MVLKFHYVGTRTSFSIHLHRTIHIINAHLLSSHIRPIPPSTSNSKALRRPIMARRHTPQIHNNLFQHHPRLYKPQFQRMLSTLHSSPTRRIQPRTLRHRRSPSDREIWLWLIDDVLAALLGERIELCNVCERPFRGSVQCWSED